MGTLSQLGKSGGPTMVPSARLMRPGDGDAQAAEVITSGTETLVAEHGPHGSDYALQGHHGGLAWFDGPFVLPVLVAGQVDQRA